MSKATSSALNWLEDLPSSVKGDARELVDGFVKNCDTNFTVKDFSFNRQFPKIDDFRSSLSFVGEGRDAFQTRAELDDWQKLITEARENERQAQDVANSFVDDFNFEKRRYMLGAFAEIAACVPTPEKLRAHPVLKDKDSLSEIENSGLESDKEAWNDEHAYVLKFLKIGRD